MEKLNELSKGQIIGLSENIIRTKSYDFALKIVRLNRSMQKSKEYVLSRQVVRSGTSIGANVEEATAAQSKRDFISKMSIASKEARETNYWLRLIRDGKLVPPEEVEGLIQESTEIIRILTSIVKTSQKNL